MYIAPNSTIKILRNVPLDPTYDHTIYFPTGNTGLDRQTAYFSGKAKYTFTEQSYQRVNRGWIRLAAVADNLYDCNYLMFQNTNFGSKWFYAFIKSVEYINNAVCEVQYEIDVIQTWNNDYTLEMCYIERQHTLTDELFENTVIEDLNLGNTYVSNGKSDFDMNEMELCILHDREANGDGSILDNVYIPIRFSSGLSINDANLNAIEAYIDSIGYNKIIAVYQYPAFMRGTQPEPAPTEGIALLVNSSIDGYTPINKKLFSYPYNLIYVSNNCGQSAEFKWELFSSAVSSIARFNVTGTYVNSPCAICYPHNYRGIAEDYEDGITYTNFPVCAFSDDTFKTWWSENKHSFVTAGITSAISGAVFPMLLSSQPELALASGAISIASSTANSLAKVEDIKSQPNQTHGQVQTDCLNGHLGRISFSFYKLSIKQEYARIIDDYFTRYGYAIKRNAVPIRNARPHWTYIKTIGCTLTGSIPADDVSKICGIYDHGITFWNNPSEVGNYSLDNTPSIVPV